MSTREALERLLDAIDAGLPIHSYAKVHNVAATARAALASAPPAEPQDVNFAAYAGSEVAGEIIAFLTEAGCGKPGTPNTIWAMTKEIIARAQTAEAESSRLRGEVAEVRRMFDVTRHRVCDRLGLPVGTSWSNIESALAALRAAPGERERALRPVVQAFARAMEAELRENDYKGGWEDMGTEYLMERLASETQELAAAVAAIRWGWAGLGPKKEEGAVMRVRSEAADVANFAMMVADVCGSLSRAPAQGPSEVERPVLGGRCCSCGYEGEEGTPCPVQEDGTHCEHWWDGPEETTPCARAPAQGTPEVKP